MGVDWVGGGLGFWVGLWGVVGRSAVGVALRRCVIPCPLSFVAVSGGFAPSLLWWCSAVMPLRGSHSHFEGILCGGWVFVPPALLPCLKSAILGGVCKVYYNMRVCVCVGVCRA